MVDRVRERCADCDNRVSECDWPRCGRCCHNDGTPRRSADPSIVVASYREPARESLESRVEHLEAECAARRYTRQDSIAFAMAVGTFFGSLFAAFLFHGC